MLMSNANIFSKKVFLLNTIKYHLEWKEHNFQSSSVSKYFCWQVSQLQDIQSTLNKNIQLIIIYINVLNL